MSEEQLAKPLVLVIFGVTGDLAQRKLLPALYQLQKAGELPHQVKIIGISRRAVTVDDVYATLQDFVGESDFDQTSRTALIARTEMREMDLLDKTAYAELLERLREIETELGNGASRLYYLSIPSQAFLPIIKLLGETGHNAPLESGDAPRLLIEKPFGYNLASAKELINVIGEHFGEGQVYRIDHYVAKETVQNILVFRFENPLFSAVWDNNTIDHISVIAHEKIGIEGRANFYEQTGALRDFVQSHLLQLLAITTMARPRHMDSDSIHAEKLKLMQAITPIAPDKVLIETVRGQYEGYRNEVDNQDSVSETFARLNLEIDNDMWRGVPMMVETGKALAEKLTEIRVCFEEKDEQIDARNQLIFRIQPKEGITVLLQTKRPGIDNHTETAEMTFDYEHSFTQRPAEAYERVIVDAMRGDQTLFATSEEVIRSWEIIENVLEQWSHGPEGLQFYAPGSNGPANT